MNDTISSESVRTVSNSIGIKLYVIDYSAVANIDSFDEIRKILNHSIQNKLQVAVSQEFYKNYEIITLCANEEQKKIAKLTIDTITRLNDAGCLAYFSSITDCDEIVEKLHSNPQVCFVYSKSSEFAESVKKFAGVCRAASAIVDDDGKLIMCQSNEQVKNFIDIKANEIAFDDAHFAVSYEGKENTVLKTHDGIQITVGKKLGRGGEGTVFDCNYKTDYVVKIYHSGQLNKLRLKKMMLMEKKQVRYDGICWPEKVVYSPKGEPVGYLMKKIKGESLSNVFDTDEALLKKFPNWTKKDSVNLALDILRKIQYLHLFGILLGDVRMQNIVIDDSGNASLVDIDSCQIDDLPSPIGFSDFTPAELQRVEFKKQLRTYQNERFSCSVLLFKILFCGAHPYDQKNGADTIEEEIAMRSFPYPQDYRGDFSRLPVFGQDEMWKHSPYQIKQLFTDIFKYDKRYSLNEMIMILETYQKFLDANILTHPSLNKISF